MQLHRSAIVTVLDELAAPAGAASMTATLAAVAMATVAVAKAAATFFARTITWTPFCPPSHQRVVDSTSPVHPRSVTEQLCIYRFPGLYRAHSVLSWHINLFMEDVSMAMGAWASLSQAS